MATIHIIGAGISGLAAATLLAEKHLPVKLYEASAHAGGRCRTSRDGDHGLHVIGAGEHAIQAYLRRIGSAERFTAVKSLALPAAPLVDYLPFLRWLRGGPGMAEATLTQENMLRDRWFIPYARSHLATLPQQVPVRALRHYLLRHLRPHLRMAADSLDVSFIRPALEFLEFHGGSVYFSHTLSRIERQGEHVKALAFARKKIPLQADDIVILATPPAVTQALLGLPMPEQAHSAITFHFVVDHREAPSLVYPTEAPMDLLRFQPGTVSASIRIADSVWRGDEKILAQRVWTAIQERYRYLCGITPMPGYTSWREKRAGHGVQDAAAVAADHGPILLAGDWLDPLQPASLEAAAASGHAAAQLAITKLPAKIVLQQRPPF